MAKYKNRSSIVKIEARNKKILFENLYWYIIYTINKYFLYGEVNWLIYCNINNSFFFFITFAIITMYLIIVANFFKKER